MIVRPFCVTLPPIGRTDSYEDIPGGSTVAIDDARIYRAAREATKQVEDNTVGALAALRTARAKVSSAGSRFKETPTWDAFHNLDKQLGKREATASKYKELADALAKAEKAIADAQQAVKRARSASAALTGVVKG